MKRTNYPSMWKLIQGDCREVMTDMKTNSIDAVVTDPPYEMGFMDKKWDKSGIAYQEDMWKEVLRLLKPGGFLLAFGGTRTYHRMVCAIEDAGFEIRDQLQWIYGGGFPKNHDISKAIDKHDKNEAKMEFVRWMQTTGIRAGEIDKRLKAKELISPTSNFAVHFFNEGQPALPTQDYWEEILRICEERNISPPDNIEEYIDLRVYGSRQYREREVVGKQRQGKLVVAPGQGEDRSQVELDITAPATPEAEQWEGWGTALKPAHEPICLAQKPREGTFADNVLRWGCGGLNIDGCRVEFGDSPEERHTKEQYARQARSGARYFNQEGEAVTFKYDQPTPKGRWPANIIHDGSDEVLAGFPETESGVAVNRNRGDRKPSTVNYADHNGVDVGYPDSGSAARFFYCAKADKKERTMGGLVDNDHPTVKPIDLMKYLCRLITPPGGKILDPFAGSGTTLIAALREEFRSVGIEKDEAAYEIANERLKAETKRLGNRLL